MKVSEIKLNNFKRFTDLTVGNIPENAKLIIVVGPNGSGKSSLFDAFNTWYRGNSGFGWGHDDKYYRKDENRAYTRHQNVTVKFFDHPDGQPVPKNSMYFRTAYRNDPDFNINSFSRVGAPHESVKVNRFIDNDATVSENYQRLVHNTMVGVYSEDNDGKSVKELRDELIGKVKTSMENVFDDLILNNIGDPLGDGSFHFKKGMVESYHYKNLSGGEKAAFDLLLDLIIKIDHYDNSVFFIDEPETHIHTALQGKLIEEIFRIIPENSQMWITTHSLGVMRKAKEISVENPESVAFIDFGEANFDDEAQIGPASINGVVWEKFLSIALGDLNRELIPEVLVMCEGDINGNKRKNFDAFLYGKIFSNKYPQITFVSGGSSNEVENPNHTGFRLLKEVLVGTRLAKLVDRDDKSQQEVDDARDNGVFVTSRRHIEAYLLDDEIIEILVNREFSPDMVDDDPENPTDESEKRAALVESAFQIKQSAIEASVNRGNPPDDIKSASGDIYVGLKRLLRLTRCGNNADMFLRDVMSELITEDTSVYRELEAEIISEILNA